MVRNIKAYSVVDVTGGMGVSTVLKLLEFNINDYM
jgi:hypothetical protein